MEMWDEDRMMAVALQKKVRHQQQHTDTTSSGEGSMNRIQSSVVHGDYNGNQKTISDSRNIALMASSIAMMTKDKNEPEMTSSLDDRQTLLMKIAEMEVHKVSLCHSS